MSNLFILLERQSMNGCYSGCLSILMLHRSTMMIKGIFYLLLKLIKINSNITALLVND